MPNLFYTNVVEPHLKTIRARRRNAHAHGKTDPTVYFGNLEAAALALFRGVVDEHGMGTNMSSHLNHHQIHPGFVSTNNKNAVACAIIRMTLRGLDDLFDDQGKLLPDIRKAFDAAAPSLHLDFDSLLIQKAILKYYALRMLDYLHPATGVNATAFETQKLQMRYAICRCLGVDDLEVYSSPNATTIKELKVTRFAIPTLVEDLSKPNAIVDRDDLGQKMARMHQMIKGESPVVGDKRARRAFFDSIYGGKPRVVDDVPVYVSNTTAGLLDVIERENVDVVLRWRAVCQLLSTVKDSDKAVKAGPKHDLYTALCRQALGDSVTLKSKGSSTASTAGNSSSDSEDGGPTDGIENGRVAKTTYASMGAYPIQTPRMSDGLEEDSSLYEARAHESDGELGDDDYTLPKDDNNDSRATSDWVQRTPRRLSAIGRGRGRDDDGLGDYDLPGATTHQPRGKSASVAAMTQAGGPGFNVPQHRRTQTVGGEAAARVPVTPGRY